MNDSFPPAPPSSPAPSVAQLPPSLPPAQKPLAKYGIWVLLGAALLIAGFIGIAAVMAARERQTLLEQGLRVDATITEMRTERRGTRRSPRAVRIMEVNFFTGQAADPAAAPASQPAAAPAVGQTPKEQLEAAMAKLSGEIQNAGKLGDYQTASLHVSASSYEKYQPGQRARVIYLKDDLQSARLLDEVE